MAEQTTRSSARDRVEAALSQVPHEHLSSLDDIPCIQVETANLHRALELLRDGAGFSMATFVTGLDHFPREPRFVLVHQLWSTEHGDRVRLQTALDSDRPAAPSCIDLWPGAAYMERECFDMFGIRFDNHAGLKRLMMPDGYDHHPLRKDFPQQGIEPDRLYRAWDRERRQKWEQEGKDQR